MIKYIDNGKKKTALLLHGLACDIVYFDCLIKKISPFYNFILPELSGHYPASEAPLSIEFEVDSIIKYCNIYNLEFQLILAHSMSSIIAFELDKRCAGIDRILLLEGNLIESDFMWSDQISTMKKNNFELYWSKFVKQYPLFLKMKVKTKNGLDKYLNGMVNFKSDHIFIFAKLISEYKEVYFESSYAKLVYLESDCSDNIGDKAFFCYRNNIEYYLINNSSHFMMIDGCKQISKIMIDL
jgi:pimeloyl-ACP methyl ester carboxylesterase